MLRMLVFSLVMLAMPLPANAADKLTVLLDWFVNPDHAPLIVAREGGYFARHGLEVDLVAPAGRQLQRTNQAIGGLSGQDTHVGQLKS